MRKPATEWGTKGRDYTDDILLTTAKSCVCVFKKRTHQEMR